MGTETIIRDGGSAGIGTGTGIGIGDGGGGGGCIGDGGSGFVRRVRSFRTTAICFALAGCTPATVRLAVPPGWQDHAAPVAAPAIPPAMTPCAYDAKALCNTDAETGWVIAAYDDALATANRKLKWFFDWFSAVPKAK